MYLMKSWRPSVWASQVKAEHYCPLLENVFCAFDPTLNAGVGDRIGAPGDPSPEHISQPANAFPYKVESIIMTKKHYDRLAMKALQLT